MEKGKVSMPILKSWQYVIITEVALSVIERKTLFTPDIHKRMLANFPAALEGFRSDMLSELRAAGPNNFLSTKNFCDDSEYKKTMIRVYAK